MIVTSLLTLLLYACPLHEGEHEQIETASVALEQAPRSVSLRLTRAELYLLHGELDHCASDLEIALGLAGESTAVVFLRARLLFARQQYALALVSVDVVLAADVEPSTHCSALHLRADCLTALLQTHAAIVAWTELLVAHPQPQPDWYLLRASLQATHCENGPALAIAGLDQGLQRLGNAVPLLLRAAALEEQLDRTDAAVARFQILADQSERKETWLQRQGALLQRAGRTVQARDYLVRALAAWQRLPAKRQGTFSMQRLHMEITTGLEALNDV